MQRDDRVRQLQGRAPWRLLDLAVRSESALSAPSSAPAGARARGYFKLRPLSRADKTTLALLALMLLAGAVLRAHAIGGNDRLSSDELGYIGDANSLLHLSGYNSFHWAPGTPLLFALFAVLSGHSEISAVTHSHGIAQYAQLLVELATLVLVGALAWSIAGRWAALLAVFAMASYEPLIVVTRTYLSEPLGGLMLVAMVAAAAFARDRDWRWLLAAGFVGGLACLAREDFLPGLLVVIVALAWARAGMRRKGARRAAVYVAGSLLALLPWVAFASIEEHAFVTVTTGGVDSLFIGTYLPGDGSQFQTVAAYRHAVCRRFPTDCDSPPGDAAPMFKLIVAEHPGDSREAAITAAVLTNLRKYALGRPLAFAGMLIGKAWSTWTVPWSGGNGTAQAPGPLASSLDRAAIAVGWLGLLLAAWIYRRRWPVVVGTAVLLLVFFFNDWFGPQPRDSLRLTPLLFTLGAAGVAGTATRLRASRAEPARTSSPAGVR